MKAPHYLIVFLLFPASLVRAGDNPAFDDENSVWYQARKGQLEALQKSLEQSPELLNAKDSLSRTPLFYAAKSGRVAVTEYLLNQKDLENSGIDAYGKTAWHWAAMYGHLDVLRLMDKYDLDVNVRGKTGDTPLHVSFGNAFSNAHNRHPQVVQVLLDMGADPNVRNKAQETPLLAACSLVGRVDAMEVLVSDKRVDLNAQDKRGDTVLHRAVGWGFVNLVKSLLANGVDLSLKNEQGETALDRLAVYKEHPRPEVKTKAKQIEELLRSHIRP